MGDRRRVREFARFVDERFPEAKSVADVAGGRGELAFRLLALGKEPTIVDPADRTFPGWVHREIRKRAASGGGIAVGISARTIERWLAAGSFPERKPRTGDKSALDEYKPYLDRRWQEGCRRIAQLCREIRGRGYSGSDSTVYEYAAYLRTGLPPPRSDPGPGSRRGCGTARVPSPRRLSWLLLRPEEEISAGEREYIGRMEPSVADLAAARALAQGFVSMMRDRKAGRLEGWLEEARSSPPELRSFAEGLRRDKMAVLAALSEDYSNGQTEGQVTRLKLIKRQMYGRANLDLLRTRILSAA